jgi:hypothetical protein
MSDPTLAMLVHEVRAKTLKRLDGLSDDQARWAPAGLQNHCLWHAGHAYVVVEFLSQTAIGKEPVIPDGWWPLFSWESRPGEVPPDHWPLLADVIGHLKSQQIRLAALVEGLDANGLDAPSRRKPEQTVRYAILHGLHDEACHNGEIWLLRKLQALEAGR